jgi:hypothetical protein
MVDDLALHPAASRTPEPLAARDADERWNPLHQTALDVTLGRGELVTIEQDVDLVVRGWEVQYFGKRAAENAILVADESVASQRPEEGFIVWGGAAERFLYKQVDKAAAVVLGVWVVLEVPEHLAKPILVGLVERGSGKLRHMRTLSYIIRRGLRVPTDSSRQTLELYLE